MGTLMHGGERDRSPPAFLVSQAARTESGRPRPSMRLRGACQTVGDDQAATAGTAISLSLAAMAGYPLVNRSRSVPSRVQVRVCRRKWAPVLDHCICCFLAKRRLTTRLTVDSANAVEIRSPVSQRALVVRERGGV